MNENNNDLKKVSMNLSKRSLDNIEFIGLFIQESNKTRVISTALEVARFILTEINQNKKVILRDENTEQELRIIIT